MNLSGDAVGRVAAFHKLEPSDVLVVVDEVQLPLGRIRLRRSGSAGGHNGLKSIIQHVGTEFPRLRIGVGRGDRKWDLADHVLARFGREERDAVVEAVNRAADAAELFVDEGHRSGDEQVQSVDRMTKDCSRQSPSTKSQVVSRQSWPGTQQLALVFGNWQLAFSHWQSHQPCPPHDGWPQRILTSVVPPCPEGASMSGRQYELDLPSSP